jgi:hypothetical protein
MAIGKRSIVGTMAGLLNGGLALFVASQVFRWILTDRWPSEPQNLWPFLVALAVLIVNVAYIVIYLREIFGAGEARYISTRAPEGTARISVRALRSALRRSVREVAGVTAARVGLRRESADRVDISATVRAAREQNAVELADRVREVLRRSFFRVVPDDGNLDLQVVVKIASLGGAPEPAPEPSEEIEEPKEPSEEEIFRGPRYPVEDMEGV